MSLILSAQQWSISIALCAFGLASGSLTPVLAQATSQGSAGGSTNFVPNHRGHSIRICYQAALADEPRCKIRRGSTNLHAFEAILNHLPPAPTGDVACPNDTGAVASLRLNISATKHITLPVEMSGCRRLWRGSRARLTTRALRRDIRQAS
jgi:hypothetical protein